MQAQRVFSLIAGIWVGSFITIGFLVVPILFSSLGDRQIAGMVAASLLKATAYIGVCISTILMVAAHYFVRQNQARYRLIRWILLAMLACAITAGFILIPWMNALRDQALSLGLSVRETSNAELFNRLHSVSSMVFMIQTLLGIYLVWQTTKNAD
ncbi:DUF4149 domain-containing protein [Polynucleobacter sp. MWH-Braz-FAM2G]|uniref:DUF4149 domain-containing protein n=1 Tax=Polynucleobacter sp. MWH-Braz-FAM2G TaxID=1855883 RepID=UPI001BFEC57E|nr:DUF4149 domain-containing protein [Polynucleobacter sp. MWH-Braz-FAM2G]QWD89849.1 DUF4149 domain-containing protein [Polynucleobacter sp. MWH-Braz-FAM2G]